MGDSENKDEYVRVEIDGTLDLHTFRPSEIGSLIPEYLHECSKKKIYHVRIIHGKGSGALRRGVHKVLADCSLVKSFSLADEKGGSWGATLIELHH